MAHWILSSRREVLSSFRLMGIHGELVEDHPWQRIQEKVRDPKITILFIGDSLLKEHKDEVLALKARSKKLMLIVPEEGSDYLAYIRHQIETSLGMKV